MGKANRRKFTAEFKARVAMEALKETSTLGELAKKYELAPEMISRWKS
jgi:transposase